MIGKNGIRIVTIPYKQGNQNEPDTGLSMISALHTLGIHIRVNPIMYNRLPSGILNGGAHAIDKGMSW